MGNYDLALSYYKRSQKMYEKIGYKWGVTDMELDIGNILLKQKKYDQALNNLEKGLKLATEINAKDQMKYGFGKLSELYAEQNNYKKALDSYILYSEVKDSIYTESKSRIIAEMDTKYETAKKEKEIELLSKNNAIHQLEIKRQRSLRNSFIIITILIFVLLAVLNNRYRVKSKANRDLENAMKVLKETQQQLVIKEKMASLGNLVAGVAHEINNPISAVKCASGTSDRSLENIIELLENNPEFSRLRTDNKFDKALHILKTNCKIISDGSGRVEKIVKSLENFVYLDKSESQKFDVHKGIEDTLTILHHTLGNRIVIEKEYSALPEIHCFPSRLNQVFMNLFTNAIQAINDNGIIKIKTSRKDDNVVIEISDNGQGIEKNHIDKIFDPGFTTKSRGVGTGLGLAIVYQIIEKHKGKINVSSKKGEGTSFEILLPLNT